MSTVSDLFDISAGHGIDLIRLNTTTADDPAGLAYVSRSERNNGVHAYVKPVPGLVPAAAGTLSVAVGGSICSTYVQPREYVCAQNVRVLTPRAPMSLREKLWWARCIRANRYRFNYGRHANRTLKDLELPGVLPEWVLSLSLASTRRLRVGIGAAVADLSKPTPKKTYAASPTVNDLFTVKYGHSLELNRLSLDPKGIAFVSRKQTNNGVTARVARIEGREPAPAGVLSVALGGSVLSTFVQLESFYMGRDVAYLVERREMSLPEKLWWAQCIEANRYRYNYGRQANRTLKDLKLPTTIPAWVTGVDLAFADVMATQIERDLDALGSAA